MVKKKSIINVYALCHTIAKKKHIPKDSVSGTHERSKFVEQCVLDQKKKKKS